MNTLRFHADDEGISHNVAYDAIIERVVEMLPNYREGYYSDNLGWNDYKSQAIKQLRGEA